MLSLRLLLSSSSYNHHFFKNRRRLCLLRRSWCWWLYAESLLHTCTCTRYSLWFLRWGAQSTGCRAGHWWLCSSLKPLLQQVFLSLHDSQFSTLFLDTHNLFSQLLLFLNFTPKLLSGCVLFNCWRQCCLFRLGRRQVIQDWHFLDVGIVHRASRWTLALLPRHSRGFKTWCLGWCCRRQGRAGPLAERFAWWRWWLLKPWWRTEACGCGH